MSNIVGIDELREGAVEFGEMSLREWKEGMESDKIESVRVSDEGQYAIGKKLGIPKYYSDKLDWDAFAYNVNYMREQYDGDLDIVVKDGEVVSVVDRGTDFLHPSDVVSTFDHALEGAGLHLDLKAFGFFPDRAYITGTFVGDDYLCDMGVSGGSGSDGGGGGTDRAVGDLVGVGFDVSFSPLCLERPRIRGFLERLVCTNGLVSPEKAFTEGLKRDTSFEQMIEVAIDRADRLQVEVERFRRMKTVVLTNVVAETMSICQEMGFPKKFVDEVLSKISVGSPGSPVVRTLYDVVNLITHLANAKSSTDRRRIQNMAGSSLGKDQYFCPTCYHVSETPFDEESVEHDHTHAVHSDADDVAAGA